MHPNAQLIARFYDAFAARDAEAMARCYAPDVVFTDPAFPELHGERAGAMWRMLCGRSQDLSIHYEGVEADDQRGKARWVADYTFTKTGRKVRNVIDAAFTFSGGAIVRHRDHFDFWRWSRQALGPAGLLLGWSTFLQRKVQAEAARALDAYMAKSH